MQSLRSACELPVNSGLSLPARAFVRLDVGERCGKDYPLSDLSLLRNFLSNAFTQWSMLGDYDLIIHHIILSPPHLGKIVEFD